MTDSPTSNVEAAGHAQCPQRQDPGPIWDEYKYRHDLCWRLVFQLTTAVVVIAVIPYIQKDVASTLQGWIIVLPVIGVFLVLLGLARLRRELELLDKVKTKHRGLLLWNYGLEYPADFEEDQSRLKGFKNHVTWYLMSLALLGAMNVVVIWFKWLPSLS